MPEQPYFEVEAHCQGTSAQLTGEVPMWSDLTLTVDILDSTGDAWAKLGDDAVTLHITRAAGEIIIDALYETLHPYAGRSIAGLMEKSLDEVVERLMTKKALDGDRELARGMAMIIAIWRAPLNPDWEQVRDDAVDRYKSKH